MRRILAAGALTVLLGPAAPVRADFFRWQDEEGVTHYTRDLDRVPRRYRASVQVVRVQTAPASGQAPVLAVEPAPPAARRGEALPIRDEGGFEEPGLGERGAIPARSQAEPVQVGAAVVPLPAPSESDPRQAEIAELERELAERREELKALISQTSFDSSRITSDPRLGELAKVVPRLQAELEALRRELEP